MADLALPRSREPVVVLLMLGHGHTDRTRDVLDHIVDSRKPGYEFTLFPQIVCLWREDVALLRRAGRTIFSS